MTLSFDEAIHALRVNPPIRSNGPAEVIVSTDSRTLRSGETFLALRGERFDGHQYVESAVQHGAAALIVERPPKKAVGVPVFLVDDTLSAYMKLAAAARAKLHATVIAVTGSTGKTT
ncbi:MAG: UDP-N-acetylmuramoyl-tripeptide--D-alanyl-D-alanine ligase, partial [Candidatus Eremiobacteraeota bacterium]|nr:UDP-N-acetylmuramoyl-tripeptide--D-alanyl-D-alanine ligase [Candidatus Eremiobacteraeota bacterium]